MTIKFSTLDKRARDFSGRYSYRPQRMGCYFLMLSLCILFLQSCAVTKDVLGITPLQDPDGVPKNYFMLDEGEDVVGRLAVIRLESGESLPDIARHFSLGINTLAAANPGTDLWVPRAGDRIVLPLSFILPEADREGIVINLAAMRLFFFKEDGGMQAVATYPVGVGTAERPTPKGLMHITHKKFKPTWYVPPSIAADYREKGDPLPAKVPPGPLNPLGEHALYLSESGYLIHGTNKPASIGLRATSGCIRLYPEDIEQLFDITPAKTVVRVINQPYLVGRRNGMVYLEAHAPFEESRADEMKKVYAKLKTIEQGTGLALDWDKIERVLAETRGIPVVVSTGAGGATAVNETIRLRHPTELHGQPQVPAFRTDAWYVLAATMRDKVEALRLAAILNHQGPQIPARVLSKSGKHRVVTGPFDTQATAEDASKRLRIDLEIDGILVAPVAPE